MTLIAQLFTKTALHIGFTPFWAAAITPEESWAPLEVLFCYTINQTVLYKNAACTQYSVPECVFKYNTYTGEKVIDLREMTAQ